MQYFINYILVHQAADGWLGPTDRTDGNCYWSKFPLLMALRQARQPPSLITYSIFFFLQYYEANTSDTRVIPAMLRFLNATHKLLFTIPLGNDSW